MIYLLCVCVSDPDCYSHQMARKQALSRWLMDASSNVTDQEVTTAGNLVSQSIICDSVPPYIASFLSFFLQESEYLSSLFSLVTGHQLPAACRLAHSHRDHKLAILLSQSLSSLQSSRELFRQQLNEWEIMKVCVWGQWVCSVTVVVGICL